MAPKIKVQLGQNPPFWDRNGIFLANIQAVFYQNPGETQLLKDTVEGLETYCCRVVPIMDLIYRKKNNLVVLSPLPEYISGPAVFDHVEENDSHTGHFEDSIFYTKDPRLLVAPAYIITRNVEPTLRIFLAEPGEGGLLTGHQTRELFAKNQEGEEIFRVPFNPGVEMELTIPDLKEGIYTFSVGEVSVEWGLFSKRFGALSKTIEKVKTGLNTPLSRELGLPTLLLYRKNIERGFKRIRQRDKYFPSQSYVASEFAHAEKLAELMLGKAPDIFSQPGVQELAYFSGEDSALCPFVIYLPDNPEDKLLPMILYLHGASGTQWEIERTLGANKGNLSTLKFPLIVPFARADEGYEGVVEKDLIQLLGLLTKYFPIDSSRRIVSGYSMGGIGTWQMIFNHSERFAAAIPIAGAFPWQFRKEKPVERKLPANFNLKIEIYHSADDKTVPISYAVKAADFLRKNKVSFEYHEYEGGHRIPRTVLEIWNRAGLEL